MPNGNDGKPENKNISNADAQIRSAEINLRGQGMAAEAQVKAAQLNLQGQGYAADAQVKAAKISQETQVQTAKIITDPNILDANETAAYELIKKTGILKDLAAFEAKLASGDKAAAADALNLEKALKKDGKDLAADGKITEKTIAAAKALIGENLDAITKYEDVLEKLGAKNPNTGETAKTSNIKAER